MPDNIQVKTPVSDEIAPMRMSGPIFNRVAHPTQAPSMPVTPQPLQALRPNPTLAVQPSSAPAQPSRPLPKQDKDAALALREQCRQICLSTFLEGSGSVRSMGITSATRGEGKSFLASIMARVLANDSVQPVILVECNWEQPSLHKMFGFNQQPGLAEWLRGECSEEIIRHRVDYNLTVISAGEGKRDAVRLLHQMHQHSLQNLFDRSNSLIIVDLPAVLTTAYGPFAASLVESLVMVVRAGSTPMALVQQASAQLQNLPVQGVVLNGVESKLPRWMQQLM